jgi:hypothetical protein
MKLTTTWRMKKKKRKMRRNSNRWKRRIVKMTIIRSIFISTCLKIFLTQFKNPRKQRVVRVTHKMALI